MREGSNLWRERLISAREDERRRLGRDLHDTLGATLTGIRLRLETAGAILADEPEARRLVTEAAHETGRLIDQIRCVVGDLRPPDFADTGLPGALRRLAARLDGMSATVTADVPDRLPDLPPALELAVYRIASESLTNALRHASASTVTTRLTADPRRRVLVLETVDDGVGTGSTGKGRWGTGLASIGRRAEELGGRCAVLPRPDAARGTLVRAVLPWGRP
ncbi:sensor histidine kinase [Streptomyces macrosporus]|uniref:histidine kinase n=1 Tax=Streptomyces macrosporus TaxID=44032 RepID=A0ABN3JYU5_9ACTN